MMHAPASQSPTAGSPTYGPVAATPAAKAHAPFARHWEYQLRGAGMALVATSVALVALAAYTQLGRVFVAAGGAVVLGIVGIVMYAVSAYAIWQHGD